MNSGCGGSVILFGVMSRRAKSTKKKSPSYNTVVKVVKNKSKS